MNPSIISIMVSEESIANETEIFYKSQLVEIPSCRPLSRSKQSLQKGMEELASLNLNLLKW